MNAFEVVPLTAEHLPAVAELERLCFGEPWSEQALTLLLGEDAVALCCLGEAGEAIAYCGMVTVLDEGQITNVAVHPRCRRMGCGRALMTALLACAERRALAQISLEVRISNRAAIALYEGVGFRRAGVRKRFYKNPCEDAWVMLWEIGERTV